MKKSFVFSTLFFLFQYERKIDEMRQEHARELKIRDDKIAFLKKQISDSLKDNSWYDELLFSSSNFELLTFDF